MAQNKGSLTRKLPLHLIIYIGSPKATYLFSAAREKSSYLMMPSSTKICFKITTAFSTWSLVCVAINAKRTNVS